MERQDESPVFFCVVKKHRNLLIYEYASKLEQLSVYPYDYIIGSIHWIGNMFPCQKVREQYSAKEFYNMY